MKIQFYLSLWRESGNSALFEELLNVYPAGFDATDSIFECKIPLPDERADAIQALVQAAGLTPRRYYIPRRGNEFELVYRRLYDESDWQASDWLQARTGETFESIVGRRRIDGVMEIEPRFFKRAIVLNGSGENSLIVSKQVRSWFESGMLHNLAFRPTTKAKGRGAANEDNLWELTTEFVMPPLSATMTFLDDRGNRIHPGQEGGFNAVDGHFTPVELHYTRSAVESAKDHDLALTWKHFGMPNGHLPEILVSKRFYKVCKSHGLKMNWIPVRIDPE